MPLQAFVLIRVQHQAHVRSVKKTVIEFTADQYAPKKCLALTQYRRVLTARAARLVGPE